MEDELLAQIRGCHSNHEWWWCFDDSLSRVQSLLYSNGHVIIDQFLPEVDAERVSIEVETLYNNGHLSTEGIIGGGRFGKDEFEIDKNIRSDVLGYFDGNEDCFGDKVVVPLLIDKMNTLLCEMRDLAPEKCADGKNVLTNDLKNISTRSKAMVTCYGGNQTRYAWHVDNPNKNGRRVTCIFYLNKHWTPEKGGYLNLFPVGGKEVSVAPHFNRLCLFWSDERCPHAVAPCQNHRFAVSVWFIDKTEKIVHLVREPNTEPASRDATSAITVASVDGSSSACVSAPNTCLRYCINDGAHEQLVITVYFSQLLLSREEVMGFTVDAFEREIRISPPCTAMAESKVLPTVIPLPCAVNSNCVIAKYKKKEGNLMLTCTKRLRL